MAIDTRDKRLIILFGAPIYVIFFVVVYFGIYLRSDADFHTSMMKAVKPEIAPDGSSIWSLGTTQNGSLAYCALAPGATSSPVRHKSVEEMWYFLSGTGEVWRKNKTSEAIVRVFPGVSLTIPLGTTFQFRSTGHDSLRFIITTMPPWPGGGEAIASEGHW